MDLELALRMCEAALKQAAREGAAISVAVVDSGGHLVSFQRMEGAGFAGASLAPGRACTAAAHRRPTAELASPPPYGDEGRHDRFAGVGGGLPLWADYGEGERVAGGVGVSGGTPEQDEACAEAAASVWRTR
ncbi:GlcG/HbpS family heme-binding protein [Nonomuraea sp. LPB2021202275-12-8]|uniref:GlcG/HbpS family heme-binding protein n=1 Tax=Nonomuraea sp. LPB2021202275-12-8 TaxID=3120159 RepID=UPI00300C8969